MPPRDPREDPGPNEGATLRLGRYTLLSRLGMGGMGEVFLARVSGAHGFEKPVVIKRILPHLAQDPVFVRRFLDEGRLVSQLRHAGIAQVLDLGEEGGTCFMAMEHVDGVDLAELGKRLRAKGTLLPIDLAVFVLVGLLDALDYAHSARDKNGALLRVVHRDVSASNVMITRGGEVKLLDFGIARAAERGETSVDGIRGKFAYMSPEQAAGLALDARSDLFSLGVLGWELLTGARPFDGASDPHTLDRVRTHDPGPVERLRPLPTGLSIWIGKLLEKSPEDRFDSAHAASLALRALAADARLVGSPRALADWLAGTVGPSPASSAHSKMSLNAALEFGLEGGPRRTVTESVPLRTPNTLAVGGLAATERAPADVASAAPRTPAPEPGTPKTRDGFTFRGLGFMLLVVMNLLLITAVVFLIYKLSGVPEPRSAPSSAPRAKAEVAEAPLPFPRREPKPSPIRLPATQPTPPAVSSASPTMPGEAFGEAVATLASDLPPDLALIIRTQPPGALISADGVTAPSPRTLRGPAGKVVTGRVSLEGYQPRSFEARLGENPALVVTLRPLARGTLRFRFLPAVGTRVTLDGQPLEVGSNMVSIEVLAGPHELVLSRENGERVTRRFEIVEGEVENLGTFELRAP